MAVSEKAYQSKSWKSQQVLVALKHSAGKIFIDVRKWSVLDGDLRPIKGMMLEPKDWLEIIRMIEETINENQLNH